MTTSSARSGLLYALCGFALLSVGDAIIKSIAGAWPGTAVAALRYSIGALGLGTLLFLKEGRRGFAMPMPKVQLLRGFSVAMATICFFSSIFLMPLADATAIGFTSPMITAILSAIFLRERTNATKLLAIVIAFGGVLLIMRPNVAELGWAALLPLAAAMSMAFVMMGNRAVAGAGTPLLMQFLVASVAVPFILTAALIGHFSGVDALVVGMPDWTIIARCTVVAVTASCAHWLIFMGTTRASAAEIAPMTYVQLLIAIGLGILLFGDWPDLTSLAGAGVIIASGLLLWRKSR
ncbi:DMT family transporter [Sphingorhabdus sp.]|uniref:DMT family transporter n=1 Tax=Sphingorhabdus sp. TaxID=1902408 RepID=UPI00391C5CBD